MDANSHITAMPTFHRKIWGTPVQVFGLALAAGLLGEFTRVPTVTPCSELEYYIIDDVTAGGSNIECLGKDKKYQDYKRVQQGNDCHVRRRESDVISDRTPSNKNLFNLPKYDVRWEGPALQYLVNRRSIMRTNELMELPKNKRLGLLVEST